jgi:hypothetical protein
MTPGILRTLNGALAKRNVVRTLLKLACMSRPYTQATEAH